MSNDSTSQPPHGAITSPLGIHVDSDPVDARYTEQTLTTPPGKQGLYDPAHEHDACGVGFVVDIKGRKSHQILRQGLQVLTNLDHRGACGSEINTGDGGGGLMQMPHK